MIETTALEYDLKRLVAVYGDSVYTSLFWCQALTQICVRVRYLSVVKFIQVIEIVVVL